MKTMLKTNYFRKVKEELLKNFYKTFIKLFPGIVDQFNTLFKPEYRFILKKDQLLNTELCIFALIRMSTSKSPKQTEDLISNVMDILPDKILPLLPVPLAARTSVISKQWRSN